MYGGTWTIGDYYCVNFNVGDNGSVFPSTFSLYYVESNEAAVVKQSVALEEVIYKVLQLTGRDKVILMGHSMGGLASREYLQNPSHWQSDGQSHVAKLVTTGTPHGGSNSTATYIGDLVIRIDDQSESVRDLRTFYHTYKNPGVYLFGGLEDLSYMNDGDTLGYFYNADVNCNGITEVNDVGLNQRNIYKDLDYSCIIGECTGCIEGVPGDGVVIDTSANINYYYPNLTTNLFYYHAFSLTDIHTALPKQIYQNMQGLDEPNEYPLAYHIGIDTNYMGFTTVQANTSSYDYDDFKFSIPIVCNLTVNINNIYISDLMAHIVDSAGNTIGTIVHSAGSSNINFSQPLNPGNYYFQIYGMPTDSSYLYPYNFTLTSEITTGISVKDNSNILIYPNPVTDNLQIQTTLQVKNIEITDIAGRVLYSTTSKNIDCSSFSNGVYFVKIETEKKVAVKKFVKE
jgi:hypothetical protein